MSLLINKAKELTDAIKDEHTHTHTPDIIVLCLSPH